MAAAKPATTAKPAAATDAKTDTVKPSAAVVAAVAATAPKAPTTAFDYDKLAEGATVATAMPKISRVNSGATNALVTLVTRSFTEKKPFTLPAIPVKDEAEAKSQFTKLSGAIRRAAKTAGLGVSVRRNDEIGSGLVVTLLGKAIGSK